MENVLVNLSEGYDVTLLESVVLLLYDDLLLYNDLKD